MLELLVLALTIAAVFWLRRGRRAHFVPSPATFAARRRRTLALLVGLTFLGVLLATSFGGVWWRVTLVVAVLLVLYVTALVLRSRRRVVVARRRAMAARARQVAPPTPRPSSRTARRPDDGFGSPGGTRANERLRRRARPVPPGDWPPGDWWDSTLARDPWRRSS